MSLEIGSLVVSRTGNDKGRVLAVIGISENHLVLADGRKRRIEKPKHKKVKHVQPLDKSLSCDVTELLRRGEVTNKLLYRSIGQCSGDIEA